MTMKITNIQYDNSYLYKQSEWKHQYIVHVRRCEDDIKKLYNFNYLQLGLNQLLITGIYIHVVVIILIPY